MFLPVRFGFDFPMIPPLDKTSIPAIAALIGCHFIARKRIAIFGQQSLIRWLLILYLSVPFVTSILNGDAVFVGGRVLQPLTLYDALSTAIGQLITIIPFLLGRQLFRSYEDHLLMFRVLLVAGLFYSLLMLFEVRMSPQLHTWVYGYFPHAFVQQIRFGGFRPVVFMGHGLLVSMFAVVIVIAASAFWQLKIKVRRFEPSVVTFYLLFVLILCKSVASILYGFAAFLLIKITSFKIQLNVARALVFAALLYPTMSIMNIFPHQTLLEWAANVSAGHVESLRTRFDNEHVLLDHAWQRSFFGWGGWGRNRVYNDWNGIETTITDGRWIITFGQYGWFGFIAEFGLLALPVLKALSAFKRLTIDKEKTLLCAHALLIGVVMIDQLPNASLDPWLWLLTGILLGRTEAIVKADKEFVPT